MALTGAIAVHARGYVPVTWDALLNATDLYGDVLLQGQVDLVKEQVFGTVIDEISEYDHPLRVIDYCAKMVAYALVSPGIDYWMNERMSVVLTGTNESDAYTDRAEKLRLLGERLAREILRDKADVFALLGVSRPFRNFPRPAINTASDDVLLTPDPRVFPAQFKTGVTKQRLT